LELLDEPEKEVVKLLSEDFGDRSPYSSANNPVATTWLISFEQIRQYYPLAVRFLTSMACPHEKNILQSLLPELGSKKDVVNTIATLKRYLFVTGDRANVDFETLYDIYRLVYLAARN
jgi:hypothetical protein